MAVAYKSAGAGTGTETSGANLSPNCPAVVDANDILVAQLYSRHPTTDPSFSPSASGWTALDPSQPRRLECGANDAFLWAFGKIADGTEDGAATSFGSVATAECRFARIYSFSGWSSGTIREVIPPGSISYLAHATDPAMPTVTTTVAGSLAVALISQSDDNAQASATGETGGDWTEAVAEYLNNALANDVGFGLQTCTPTANPGTVTGGTVSTVNDPVGVLGFEIRPSPLVHSIAAAIDLTPAALAAAGRETFIAAALDAGMSITVALTAEPPAGATEYFIAAALDASPAIAAALGRETFLSANMDISPAIAAALGRETFIAATQDLSVALAGALTRETFVAASLPLTPELQAGLTRETFIAASLDMSTIIADALGRETFVGAALPIALTITVNLTIEGQAVSHKYQTLLGVG